MSTNRMFQIERLLHSASLLVNVANQVVIHFEKPDEINLEDVRTYLNNLGHLPMLNAGCGDPE